MVDIVQFRQYDFVDCVFINWQVDNALASVVLLVESYYPLEQDGSRRKGKLQILTNGLIALNVMMNEEFAFDLQLPYDDNGEDAKANEIAAIDVSLDGSGRCCLTLDSDMLQLNMIADSIEYEQVQ